MMTKRVVSSYNQKGGKRKWQSTWGPRSKGSQAIARDASTKYVRLRPLRSRSQWLIGSLATATKKEEKEDDNQHEDHN
jgi:hypothetical protein